MAEFVKELTSVDKIRRPFYKIVINWIDALWNAIDNGLIQRFFKYYSISNS